MTSRNIALMLCDHDEPKYGLIKLKKLSFIHFQEMYCVQWIRAQNKSDQMAICSENVKIALKTGVYAGLILRRCRLWKNWGWGGLPPFKVISFDPFVNSMMVILVNFFYFFIFFLLFSWFFSDCFFLGSAAPLLPPLHTHLPENETAWLFFFPRNKRPNDLIIQQLV